MNDAASESNSEGTAGVAQGSIGVSSAVKGMPVNGLNTGLDKHNIETFRVSELSEDSGVQTAKPSNPGEVLHNTVFGAGGVHAGLQRIASGDFARASNGADFGARDDQDIHEEPVNSPETTTVSGKSREAVSADDSSQTLQVDSNESLPGEEIGETPQAVKSAIQPETAPVYAVPREKSVPEGDTNEDLLKLLAQITEKIEEEEDPEERVTLIEALIALVKAMVALGIKAAREAGKDILTPKTLKEI